MVYGILSNTSASLQRMIQNIHNTMEKNGKDIGLTKGQMEVIEDLMSKIKLMISDGIQRHELKTLSGLVNLLGDLLPEFADEARDVMKSLSELKKAMEEDGRSTGNSFGTATPFAQNTMALPTVDDEQRDDDGSAIIASVAGAELNRFNQLNLTSNLNLNQRVGAVDKAGLDANNKVAPKFLEIQRQIAQKLIQGVSDVLLDRITNLLERKGFGPNNLEDRDPSGLENPIVNSDLRVNRKNKVG